MIEDKIDRFLNEMPSGVYPRKPRPKMLPENLELLIKKALVDLGWEFSKDGYHRILFQSKIKFFDKNIPIEYFVYFDRDTNSLTTRKDGYVYFKVNVYLTNKDFRLNIIENYGWFSAHPVERTVEEYAEAIMDKVFSKEIENAILKELNKMGEVDRDTWLSREERAEYEKMSKKEYFFTRWKNYV